jgi:peptide/nickel transport system substrate-binding protein
MLKRTLGFLVLVAAILGTSLVGLSQSYGGTLTAAISADPVGFDPHKTSAYSSFEVLENVYDTLVSVGDDLRPIPALPRHGRHPRMALHGRSTFVKM